MSNSNNETNLLLDNKSKSHFFIGNMFKNEQHNYIIKNNYDNMEALIPFFVNCKKC